MDSTRCDLSNKIGFTSIGVHMQKLSRFSYACFRNSERVGKFRVDSEPVGIQPEWSGIFRDIPSHSEHLTEEIAPSSESVRNIPDARNIPSHSEYPTEVFYPCPESTRNPSGNFRTSGIFRTIPDGFRLARNQPGIFRLARNS